MKINLKRNAVEVYGLWHGGHGYVMSDPAHDLEIFGSMSDAVYRLRRRWEGSMWGDDYRYVFKERRNGIKTPAVGDNTYIELWYDLPEDVLTERPFDFGEPDRYVFFGPRMGVVLSTTFEPTHH